MTTIRRRLATGLVPVAAVLLITGCTQEAGPKPLSPDAVADRYGYDAESAQLTPVYELVPQFKDPRDGYARDLLAHSCLSGVVDYKVVKPGTTTSLVDERTGQLQFDETIASQWGYPQLRLPRGVSVLPAGVEITPTIQAAMETCGTKADERLGTPPERLLNDIETAGWDASTTDAGVKEAAVNWKQCMEPLGVIDLPDDPNQMPTASVTGGASASVQTTTGTQTDTVVPLTPREREVAIADAQCRVRVDYPGAVLRARAAAELAAIGHDVKAFDAVREQYKTYEAGIDKAIAENG